MKNLVIVLVLYNLPVINLSLNCTHTNDDDDSPQKNKACVFPFSLKNETYYKCTKNHDPKTKPWCSTRVSSDGEHLADMDEWGQCDPGTKFTRIDLFLEKFLIVIFNHKPVQ